MSTVSAGLVKVENLTVTGSQSGAVLASNLTVEHLAAINVTAGNFDFNNLDVSGNLIVGNNLTVGTKEPSSVKINGELVIDILSYNLSSTLISDSVSVPYLITFDSNDNLYSANYGTNSITVYNSSGSLINTITDGVYTPAGVAIDPNSHHLYVSNYPNGDDTSGNTITVYDQSGVLINTFGHGSVNWPNAISFGPDGNLYVPNQAGGNVTVYNTAGILVNTLTNPTMTGPYSITFDAAGNFYILNNPVPFDASGNYNLDDPYTNVSLYDSEANLLQTITEDIGNADACISATINGVYRLYVSNSGSNKVNVYSALGVLVNSITGGMNGPAGIAFNSENTLYVGNTGNNIFTTYTQTLPVSKFSVDINGNNSVAGNLNVGGNYSLSPSIITNGLSYPYLITIDSSDNLYSANYGTNDVTVYNPAGILVNTITGGMNTPVGVAIEPVSRHIYVANWPNGDDTSGNNITVYDQSGNLLNTFGHGTVNWPNAITFHNGLLYVPNLYGHSVTVYNTSGVLITTFSGPTFSGPYSITFDSSENFYVLNNPNALDAYGNPIPDAQDPYTNISKYDPSGNLLQTIINEVHNADALISATINGTYNLYSSNSTGNSISIYDANGNYITKITGGLNVPGGLAFNSTGTLYVANTGLPNIITTYNLSETTLLTVGGISMTQSQWTYLVGTVLAGH